LDSGVISPSLEKHTIGIGSKLVSKMGYTGGGLGKNGRGIIAPINLELKSPRTCLGYDVDDSSLPTLGFADTKAVLFVVGSVQTELLEEQLTA